MASPPSRALARGAPWDSAPLPAPPAVKPRITRYAAPSDLVLPLAMPEHRRPRDSSSCYTPMVWDPPPHYCIEVESLMPWSWEVGAPAGDSTVRVEPAGRVGALLRGGRARSSPPREDPARRCPRARSAALTDRRNPELSKLLWFKTPSLSVCLSVFLPSSFSPFLFLSLTSLSLFLPFLLSFISFLNRCCGFSSYCSCSVGPHERGSSWRVPDARSGRRSPGSRREVALPRSCSEVGALGRWGDPGAPALGHSSRPATCPRARQPRGSGGPGALSAAESHLGDPGRCCRRCGCRGAGGRASRQVVGCPVCPRGAGAQWGLRVPEVGGRPGLAGAALRKGPIRGDPVHLPGTPGVPSWRGVQDTGWVSGGGTCAVSWCPAYLGALCAVLHLCAHTLIIYTHRIQTSYLSVHTCPKHSDVLRRN